MRGVFVDANPSLADIFERQRKSGDPDVRVNRDPDIRPGQITALLDGAQIVIIDHTALPTDVARQCHGLKHVVFLGTGARSYMNPEELGDLGIEVHLIKGYGDTAVAECAIALMWAAARGLAQMDRHTPPDVIARLEAILRGCAVKSSIETHAGVDHGYALPDRDIYHAAASEKDWSRVFALFDRELGAAQQ